MEPLISVVIPVYNVEKYLDRCIESVTEQSYHNLEIILIDDGSTDSSPVLCDKWGEKDSRIRVIHQTNGGQSAARNAGMRIAHGEYIAFVDSDDRIMPALYEKLLTAVNEYGADIACCNVYKVWEKEDKQQIFIRHTDCTLKPLQAMEELLRERKLNNTVWDKLYKADIVRELYFPVGKCNEDVFWSFRAISRAKLVCCVDYFGYAYMQRPDSIMGVKYSEKRLDGLEAQLDFTLFVYDSFPALSSLASVRLFETLLYHGQMAMLHLEGQKKTDAIKKIKKISSLGNMHLSHFVRENPKYGIWFLLSVFGFSFVCRVRNGLGIGL